MANAVLQVVELGESDHSIPPVKDKIVDESSYAVVGKEFSNSIVDTIGEANSSEIGMKTCSFITTCQIASPDFFEATIGWSPRLSNETLKHLQHGSWQISEPLKQAKSRANCPLSNNSSKYKEANQNPAQNLVNRFSLLTRDAQCDECPVNENLSNNSDSDCVVEYVTPDQSNSCSEIGETFEEKHQNSRPKRNSKNKRQGDRNAKRLLKKYAPHRVSRKKEDQAFVKSKDKGIIMAAPRPDESSDDESFLETNDELNSEEIENLKSNVRRSSRVIRPVYDTFIDQQATDERLLEALGRSDKKFASVNDDDITDSEGGNDSDFKPNPNSDNDDDITDSEGGNDSDLEGGNDSDLDGGNDSDLEPKVKESKKRAKIDIVPKGNQAGSKNKKLYGNRGPKIKIKNIYKQPARKERTPLISTAPKRRPETGNTFSKNASNSRNSSCYYPTPDRLLLLQNTLNRFLGPLTEPIPKHLRRIESMYVANDSSYEASKGVLLNFLLKATVNEIPSRTSSSDTFDADSFNQGGLIFVQRTSNSNDWKKDRILYHDPETYTYPIPGSGGEIITKQIYLAQIYSLKRIVVWTSINPEFVAINYVLFKGTSRGEPLSVSSPSVSNVTLDEDTIQEPFCMEGVDVRAETYNATSSKPSREKTTYTLDKKQQTVRQDNPFLPSAQSSEFPNTSYQADLSNSDNRKNVLQLVPKTSSNPPNNISHTNTENSEENIIDVSSEEEGTANSKLRIQNETEYEVSEANFLNVPEWDRSCNNATNRNIATLTQQNLNCRPISDLLQNPHNIPLMQERSRKTNTQFFRNRASNLHVTNRSRNAQIRQKPQSASTSTFQQSQQQYSNARRNKQVYVDKHTADYVIDIDSDDELHSIRPSAIYSRTESTSSNHQTPIKNVSALSTKMSPNMGGLSLSRNTPNTPHKIPTPLRNSSPLSNPNFSNQSHFIDVNKRKTIVTARRPESHHPLRQNQCRQFPKKALSFDNGRVDANINILNTEVDLKPDVIDVTCDSEMSVRGNVSLREPIIPSIPDGYTISHHNPKETNNPYKAPIDISRIKRTKQIEIERCIEVSSDEEELTNDSDIT